jgi:ABC-type Fe3+ transport system permease subunit
MAKIRIATQRTATILAFAALYAASAYGVLSSAAGLAQVHGQYLHVALPIGINSVMVLRD